MLNISFSSPYTVNLNTGQLPDHQHSGRSCMKSAAGWTSRNQIPPLTANDAIFVSAKDRADVMNFAFSRQCSAPAMTSFPPLPAPATTLNFMPVTGESVEQELRSLDVHKASDLDGLSPRLL